MSKARIAATKASAPTLTLPGALPESRRYRDMLSRNTPQSGTE